MSKIKIPPRLILSVFTILLVIYIISKNLSDIKEVVQHISETNIFFLLLLIPEQLFMYFCCGQMFFSFMAAKEASTSKHSSKSPLAQTSSKSTPSQTQAPQKSSPSQSSLKPSRRKKVPLWTLMRISLELNFVNHAVPAGGLGGLGYITWRLRAFGASAGQASFMYALRYIITICANQFQTIIAIIALLIFGTINSGGIIAIIIASIVCCTIIFLISALIAIASNKSRIDRFSKFITSLINNFVKIITFGRRPNIIQRSVVDKYLFDVHDDIIVARKHKRILIHPIIWGIIYSFLEISAYWIVACSLGHPELLPFIMIGEAIGSVLGAIIPYGLYELGMASVMVSLGVSPALAGLVVIMTRIMVLAGTIISGYGFYQHAITKVGHHSK